MTDYYDLVIIGAGIQGVGVAQAASAAGYRVLVLERTGIASATSSQSSKLIHGGLRYLETGQVRLVRESLRERALLLKLAPELVQLVPFYLPVYQSSRRKSWQLRLGLNLYRALGGGKFKALSKKAWQPLDGLVTDNLVSVFRYFDGQTDDAQLTRAVMRSAESLGAELKLPAEFVSAQLEEEHCEVVYREGTGPEAPQQNCRCAVLVNCAGPWAHQLLEQIEPKQLPMAVDLVQGSHLWLKLAAPSGCFYLEAPRDGRGVFVMPWHGEMLLGTTETLYKGPPEEVRTLPTETDYLLETLAHYFPHVGEVSEREIKQTYCGLRVLPKSQGRPFRRSREVLLSGNQRRAPRLVSVMGGKLTTYRLTAQKVMTMLRSSLPAAHAVGDTARLPLSLD